MALVKCRICFKEFYVKPNHQKRGWGKYCSIICRSKSQRKGKLVNCSICKREIYRSPKSLAHSKSRKYFCSKTCQTLWRNETYIGDKSRKWINGENAYRSILKRSGLLQVCQLCGISDIRVLNAHHKDHNRSNNEIDNLAWLCLNCHYLVHHDKELDEKVRLV